MENFAGFPEYVICFNSLLRAAMRVCVDRALKKGSGSGGLGSRSLLPRSTGVTF